MIKNILALGFMYPSDLETAGPLASRLVQKGHLSSFVLSANPRRIKTNEVRDLAQKNNLHFEFAKPSEDLELTQQIENARRTLVEKLWLVFNQKSVSEKCIHLNVNLSKVVASLIGQSGTLKDFSFALHYYEHAKKLLTRDNPRAILLTNENSTEGRLCSALAEKRGLKVVVVPSYFSQLSGSLGRLLSFAHSFPSHVWAVMGPAVKDCLQQLGVFPIEVTGLPKFKSQTVAATSNKNVGGVFLLALQDLPENRLIIQSALSAMKEFPEKLLVIKCHPLAAQRIPPSIWFQIKRSKNVTLVSSGEFVKLLEHAELLLTGTSVTAYEAILSDKPVAILNFASRFYPYNLIEHGAVIEIKNPMHLASTIREILKNAALRDSLHAGRKKIRDGFAPPIGTDSTNQIMELLLEDLSPAKELAERPRFELGRPGRA